VRDGTGQCCYRIAQEGLPFLLPHITLQRLQLPLGDFMRLLRERSVPIPFINAPSFVLGIEGAARTPALLRPDAWHCHPRCCFAGLDAWHCHPRCCFAAARCLALRP
jgi:hypothetical protein